MKKVLLCLVLAFASCFAFAFEPVIGEVSTAVKPGNVKSTICKTGYTDTVRPGTYYTNTVKGMLLGPNEAEARTCVGVQYLAKHDWKKAAYACAAKFPPVTDKALLSQHKLDHKVPIEVGGHTDSINNLQVETVAEAKKKDVLENRAHDGVCSGKLPLREAQRQFIQKPKG